MRVRRQIERGTEIAGRGQERPAASKERPALPTSAAGDWATIDDIAKTLAMSAADARAFAQRASIRPLRWSPRDGSLWSRRQLVELIRLRRAAASR